MKNKPLQYHKKKKKEKNKQQNEQKKNKIMEDQECHLKIKRRIN